MNNEAHVGSFTVGGQPSEADLRRLVDAGHKTVINVRMPDELPSPEQPKIPSGVEYHDVPLNGATISASHVARVRDALAASKGTALVHCAGGTRAAVVVAAVLAEKAGDGAAGARRRIEAAGFDVADSPYAQFVERYFGGSSSA